MIAPGKKDLLLGNIYIPPENSRYYDPQAFENLELEATVQKIKCPHWLDR
jgi:hypothetical protein